MTNRAPVPPFLEGARARIDQGEENQSNRAPNFGTRKTHDFDPRVPLYENRR